MNTVKYVMIVSLMLSLNVPAMAQNDTVKTESEGEVIKAKQEIIQLEEKVFDVVEQMPQFPGGPSAMFEYIRKNTKYPAFAKDNAIQGRVICTFVVERDGSITDVKVVKSVDSWLDKEAERVIKAMPHWTPGKQNGMAVRVKYTVPVSFRIYKSKARKTYIIY